jgi:ubiquinol-cytochrome c reductase cytochrome b subunit
MLSGTGLRIVEGILMAIPFIGTQLVVWVFGGRFPGEIIEHLYPVHVLVVPVLIGLLLIVRAGLGYARGQAALPPSATKVAPRLGVPLWPDAAVRAAGLTGITAAVLFLLGATSTISPIWSYGPTSAGNVGAGSQPDWYTGFLDGALRLVPAGWETEWFGWTWTFAILVPLVAVGVWFLGLLAYPFVESWVTRDVADHHVLDRPRNVPARTGIGVAGAFFYGVLWAAGSADIISTQFQVSFESVITAFQVLLVLGPPLAFELTRRICIGLQLRDRDVAEHGHPTGRIVRLADGGYVEVHVPASAAQRRALAVRAVEPPPARLGSSGRPARLERLRAAISRSFAVGHVTPGDDPSIQAGRGLTSAAQNVSTSTTNIGGGS